MNNFTFGNARYQYYETISGGSGAGALIDNAGQVMGGFNGTSVVQTHMTNSRLTDPEVFEFRFPVRLESYAIRAGSGGAGHWHGGDGGAPDGPLLPASAGAGHSDNGYSWPSASAPLQSVKPAHI
jgi:5-oxoprolinase (ATP-hydrolysing)